MAKEHLEDKIEGTIPMETTVDMMTSEQKEILKRKVAKEYNAIANCWNRTISVYNSKELEYRFHGMRGVYHCKNGDVPKSKYHAKHDAIEAIKSVREFHGLPSTDEYNYTETMDDVKGLLWDRLEELTQNMEKLQGISHINMNYFIDKETWDLIC